MVQRVNYEFAYNGDKTTIPETDTRRYVTMTNGFSADYETLPGTDPNAKLVERTKQNWLFSISTSSIKEWQNQFAPNWIAGKTPEGYRVYSLVRNNQNLFRSITDGNIATPGDDPYSWELQRNQGEQRAFNPIVEHGTIDVPLSFQAPGPGSYNFIEDTVVNQCPNRPTGAVSGHLETYRYGTTGNEIVCDNYLDYRGAYWVSSYYAGTGWTSWYKMDEYQKFYERGYYDSISVPTSITLDSFVTTGSFFINALNSQLPSPIYEAGHNAHLQVILESVNYVIQIVTDASNGRRWSRVAYGGQWYPWKESGSVNNPPYLNKGILNTFLDLNASLRSVSYCVTDNAASIGNSFPINGGGYLEVIWDGVNDSYQRYSSYSGLVYTRTYVATRNQWTAWKINAHAPGKIIKSFSPNPPPGCFICDGRSLAKADYPGLFEAIGTRFGQPDAAHFNIPLLDRGASTVSGEVGDVSPTVGRVISHGHAVTDPGHFHAVTDPHHVHAVVDPGHVHAYRGHVEGWWEYKGGGGSAGVGVPLVEDSAVDTSYTGLTCPGVGSNIGIYAGYSVLSLNPSGVDRNSVAGVYVRMYIVF